MGKALYLTVEETAEILAVSGDLVYDLARDGEIPSVKLGRVIRIPRDLFHAQLEKQAADSLKPAPRRVATVAENVATAQPQEPKTAKESRRGRGRVERIA